jgi:hypothetical protein
MEYLEEKFVFFLAGIKTWNLYNKTNVSILRNIVKGKCLGHFVYFNFNAYLEYNSMSVILYNSLSYLHNIFAAIYAEQQHNNTF